MAKTKNDKEKLMVTEHERDGIPNYREASASEYKSWGPRFGIFKIFPKKEGIMT